jgi:hypothetical protein
MSSPDQSETEGSDEAVSAGELGQAVNANSPAGHMGQADVVIGEIPDADDPTQLVTPRPPRTRQLRLAPIPLHRPQVSVRKAPLSLTRRVDSSGATTRPT